MSDPWADMREGLVEDLGELFAQRFDELPDDYKPTFIDILAFLRGDPLAPEMTAMKVAESRRDRDALLAVVNMAIAYEQTLAPFGSADEGFYHVGDEIALDNFQDAITAYRRD